MTTNSNIQPGPVEVSGLLSSEERAILGQIATKEPPYSERAQALLALDEGASQADAGHQSGLTKGQMRYWLTKFRQDRLGIFSKELLDQVKSATTDLLTGSAEQTPSPDVQVTKETAAPADTAPIEKGSRARDKKKSAKKPKKGKKSGKSAGPKQGRKTKKEKKPVKISKKKVAPRASRKKSKTGKRKRNK